MSFPVPLLAGPGHEEILSALHAHLKPRTYLEIGVDRGETLKLARCPSIGIDPNMQVNHQAIGQKPACLLYRMESDRFFDANDPEVLLGAKIDFAFLDGMHLFEFLLRDFINVERHCRRNSLIVLHDCVPTDLYFGSPPPRRRSAQVHHQDPKRVVRRCLEDGADLTGVPAGSSDPRVRFGANRHDHRHQSRPSIAGALRAVCGSGRNVRSARTWGLWPTALRRRIGSKGRSVAQRPDRACAIFLAMIGSA
jgi:hypothetical protein